MTNLVFVQDGGRITGDADYNIQAKSFRGDAQGNGFDLSHIQRLQSREAQLGGALSFDLHAVGHHGCAAGERQAGAGER